MCSNQAKFEIRFVCDCIRLRKEQWTEKGLSGQCCTGMLVPHWVNCENADVNLHVCIWHGVCENNTIFRLFISLQLDGKRAISRIVGVGRGYGWMWGRLPPIWEVRRSAPPPPPPPPPSSTTKNNGKECKSGVGAKPGVSRNVAPITRATVQ